MSENKIVLYPGEAEKMIESIKPILPENIASKEWYKQQDYIEKINIQAVLSASTKSDEFIKEFLITYDKLDILVENLICLEIWIEKIFEGLNERNFIPKHNFLIYTILYHEASIVNLFETVLYHSDSMERMEKGLIDLFDYCYRHLVQLTILSDNTERKRLLYRTKVGENDSNKTGNDLDDLENQRRNLKFEISLKCVSIINYFITHMPNLPLAIANRIYTSCDIVGVFVGFIQKLPWCVELENGKIFKFVDNNWVLQANWLQVRSSLSKLDGQIWLGLYQMLSNENCRNRYELSSFRRGILIGLRNYLTEPLLEQLPLLQDLRRFLEELSMSEMAAPKPSLVVEQIAEIRDSIVNNYEKRWPEIISKFLNYLSSSSCESDLQRLASNWSQTYTQHGDVMSQLFDNNKAAHCPVCSSEAQKRCSRCKSEWYCSRQCQVEHWKKHKPACDLLVSVHSGSGD